MNSERKARKTCENNRILETYKENPLKDNAIWELSQFSESMQLVDAIYNDSIINGLREKLSTYHHSAYVHCTNVAIRLIKLDFYMHHPQSDIINMAKAALILDIGYIDLPLSYFQKEKWLEIAEYENLKTHSVRGAYIAKDAGLSETIQSYILNHHENAEGLGYPSHKHGNLLSDEQLEINLSDRFEAMQEKRPYREAKSLEDAYGTLINMCSTEREFHIVEKLKLSKQMFG